MITNEARRRVSDFSTRTSNLDRESARRCFYERRLAVVPNVLDDEVAQTLIREAASLRSLAQEGRDLRYVHSGQLIARNSLFLNFMVAPALTRLVNEIVQESEELGVCPGATDAEYSLWRNDFGCKINYYEGDKRGIGWHYDKETSWVDKTYVVIYTILLRPAERVDFIQDDIPVADDSFAGSTANSKTPTSYEIVERGKRVAFVVEENSLHIHDTTNVYHRATLPQGWRRWIFIMHFTKAPCRRNERMVGMGVSLIARNIVMRGYTELFVEKNWLAWLAVLTVSGIILFLVITFVIRRGQKKAIEKNDNKDKNAR